MVHRVPLVVLFTTLIGLGLGTLVAGPAGGMVGANLGFGVVGALYWYNQLVGFDRTPHVGADGRFDFEHDAGFDKNQFSARERARIANAADPVACAHRLAGEAEHRAAMEAKYGPRAASVTPPTSFMGIGRRPTTPAQRLIQLREVCTPYYDDDHPRNIAHPTASVLPPWPMMLPGSRGTRWSTRQDFARSPAITGGRPGDDRHRVAQLRRSAVHLPPAPVLRDHRGATICPFGRANAEHR